MAKKRAELEARSGTHVCPWWLVKSFDNFLRPYIHNPDKLFGPYVKPGMTVLDVGCGRGFATLGLARLVGEAGKVIAADLQPEMLEMVRARARDDGLSRRIVTHQCRSDRIGVTDRTDFALAFFMVHEVPDQAAFIAQIAKILRPSGRFFVAEPLVHTTRAGFDRIVSRAQEAGLSVLERPKVVFGRAVVFVKKGR
jgi:ubiquinone/menaquinone biosynthesis C-methylase UbiE